MMIKFQLMNECHWNQAQISKQRSLQGKEQKSLQKKKTPRQNVQGIFLADPEIDEEGHHRAQS